MIHSKADAGALGPTLVQIAVNVANRAQRDDQGEIALRIFNLITGLQDRWGDDCIPPGLAARSTIPAAAFAQLLLPAEQTELINRFAQWSNTSFDDDDFWNSALGLYNVVYSLAEHNCENALRAFQLMCGLFSQREDLSPDYCVAAAFQLISKGGEVSLTAKVRGALRDLLPRALDPEYVVGKEREWEIDLAALKRS